MDFQFWIWLIVVVITLIARANKKKAGPAPEEDLSEPQRGNRPSRPAGQVTFEDLLREIQGQKALSREPAPKAPTQKAEKQYDFVDYDDDIPEEIQEFETVDYSVAKDEEAFKTYQAAQKQAEKVLIEGNSSKVGRIVRSEHFKEYDLNKKRRPSFNFLDELKDPKGFKKAFIMSEILNKKY